MDEEESKAELARKFKEKKEESIKKAEAKITRVNENSKRHLEGLINTESFEQLIQGVIKKTCHGLSLCHSM
jgi:lipid II:glycine glycyltransferase (peptidoglycan interpeptide bridge formation enzyme)